MSRCLINGCNSTPSGFSASGLCPVHHEAAIRLRLVVPGARASANTLRVILAVELAERCRREHAALPDLHERLRRADLRAEEQAAEIGYLRGRVQEIALERAAEVGTLRERLAVETETIRIEAEREQTRLLQRANSAEERAEREVAQAWSLTEAERDGLRARVEELQRIPPVAVVEREEEIARTMLSLQDLQERAERAEAERDALREQLVAADRRVKGAEVEAATLRRLRGAAPAESFNRRPADGRRAP